MRKAFATLLVPFALLAACNDTPAERISDDYGLLVKEVLTSESRIKIDFLWVVDDSSSMCQEQNALARDFKVFMKQLESFSNIDYRIAVTTTDVRSADFKGAFRNTPAQKYGPACQFNVIRECTVDAQCAYLKPEYGPMWECSWEGARLVNTVNENGSVNSQCHKGCDDAGDCGVFNLEGEDTYQCSTTSGAVGCFEPPQVGDCPDALTKVLSNVNFDNFYCNATVGADGTPNKNLEAGLKAGWQALNRPSDMCQSDNPNTCDLYSGLAIKNKQAWIPSELSKVKVALDKETDATQKARLTAYKEFLDDCAGKLKDCSYFINEGEPNFLRDDAYLVVLYVTDEDDCSDRDDNPLSLNDTKLCAYQDENLIPINVLVSYYRSLKADPAKVIAVGIVGDGLTKGTDSCVMSDECIFVRAVDECTCYKAGTDKSDCPELLQGTQHAPGFGCASLAVEEDEALQDPELRKTHWYLSQPPTDWCDPREGEAAVQKPDTSNCYLLADMLAAYDTKIEQLTAWAQTPAEQLDDAQNNCVKYLATFQDERAVVSAAYDKCKPKLAEELAYRQTCLDGCMGKKQYKPDHKCAKLVPDFCKCYDHDAAGKAVNADLPECKAAFEDEPAYRLTCKRECFVAAKQVSAVQPNTAPHVCSSVNGIADYGRRYVDFISRFGRNGILANICSAGGIGRSLEEIATSILPIIFRVCIPKAPEDEGELRVVRTSSDGDVNVLMMGPDADFEVVPDSQCLDTGKALVFHPVPAPSDKVEIYYNAATKAAAQPAQ
jgi:hypothetical protein